MYVKMLKCDLIYCLSCAGPDQPVGGEPGAAAGGAVPAAVLHGLAAGLRAPQPQSK